MSLPPASVEDEARALIAKLWPHLDPRELPTMVGIVEPVVRALLVERETRGWQPMDSAPKDGTAILILSESSEQRVGWWGTCGWTYYQKYGGTSIVMLKPTHWMPLPVAPPGASHV